MHIAADTLNNVRMLLISNNNFMANVTKTQIKPYRNTFFNSWMSTIMSVHVIKKCRGVISNLKRFLELLKSSKKVYECNARRREWSKLRKEMTSQVQQRDLRFTRAQSQTQHVTQYEIIERSWVLFYKREFYVVMKSRWKIKTRKGWEYLRSGCKKQSLVINCSDLFTKKEQFNKILRVHKKFK